ncbi:MAG TPA: nitrite/sulfite reductase [Bryobacteraceae bacterium]|nr:nitrite/sulfite reductase [Bryobacteraceae bacterium]
MAAVHTNDIPTNLLNETEAEYDATVRSDIELFRSYAEKYMAGGLSDDDFRAQRLRRGIYGQRQAAVHMVRTKIPGGAMTADQMDQLAMIADEFGGGKGHLTTRQNIQYHFVPLPRVADLLHKLADYRLTTREACYNTVRNVTACPLSGLLAEEPFDVRPYARQVAFAFLHKELTDAMPRKFKIAFSGCKEDCMVGAIHDVGLRAVIRDGRRGFRMVVGGGLGPLPVEAQLLDEFVPVENLVSRIEAVLRLFNTFGNRKNKNKARLKFVLRERGWDWVKEEIERNYADIQANGGIATPEVIPDGFGGFQAAPPPLGTGAKLPPILGANGHGNGHKNPAYERWLETNIREQKQTGYAMVTVKVPQGNLSGKQMHGLAQISRSSGDSLLRVTVDQNLVLAYIPLRALPQVYQALEGLELAEGGAYEIEDVTTCPGAYSCNLALTKSMNLGAAVADVVRGYQDPQVRRLNVKISGCPNSCGQHWLGDIGFYGNARKIDGKEVPYYLMLLGGGYDSGGMLRFGVAVQSIPARLAPEAVRRVLDHYIAKRQDGESFRDYVLRHKVETFRGMTNDLVKPPELAPEMFRDWGDEEAYSLQLGRGECAS